MKPGDLTTGAAKLHKAWQKLLVRWEQTQLEWHDAVSRDFEINYLQKLEPQIIATLDRMKTVATTFAGAENDCGR